MQAVCRAAIPAALSLLTLSAITLAEDRARPCVSGPRPGQRPGPYSAVVVTGEYRGQPHCFVCETADRPAVIVFARTPSPALGRLAAGLDRALAEHKTAELRAWVTFLGEDESALAPRLLRWAARHALRGVPLGVYEDPAGPPGYRLSRDADVTVLLSVKQKVVRNFAYRAGELTDAEAAEMLRAVPELLGPPRR
jgi:hypothetical protein